MYDEEPGTLDGMAEYRGDDDEIDNVSDPREQGSDDVLRTPAALLLLVVPTTLIASSLVVVAGEEATVVRDAVRAVGDAVGANMGRSV